MTSTQFVSAVPIIPARDLPASTGWYRDELGFEVFHVEPEYGIVGRGESWIHFLGSSGIAPKEPLEEKPWGFGEFSVIDLDGNRVTFFEAPEQES